MKFSPEATAELNAETARKLAQYGLGDSENEIKAYYLGGLMGFKGIYEVDRANLEEVQNTIHLLEVLLDPTVAGDDEDEDEPVIGRGEEWHPGQSVED